MNVQHMKLAYEFLQIINEVARLNFLECYSQKLMFNSQTKISIIFAEDRNRLALNIQSKF